MALAWLLVDSLALEREEQNSVWLGTSQKLERERFSGSHEHKMFHDAVDYLSVYSFNDHFHLCSTLIDIDPHKHKYLFRG